MCSGSLSYLLDLGEVTEEAIGGLVNCQLPSGLSPGSEENWQGTIQPASSLNYPQGASIPALQILLYIEGVENSTKSCLFHKWLTLV
jgi:hypothetical protein